MLKVVIEQHVLDQIHNHCLEYASQKLETSCYLCGTKENDILHIKKVIPASKEASHSPASCSGISNEIGKKLMEAKNEGYILLGEAHLHHSGMAGPTPSYGDIHTLKSIKNRFPDYLCGIVYMPNLTEWSFNLYMLEKSRAIRLDVEVHEGAFDRTEGLYSHDVLKLKKVLIFGMGTGGAEIAKHLRKAGVGKIGLLDNEKLEEVNVCRHLLGKKSIGKYKAPRVATFLKPHGEGKITSHKHKVEEAKRGKIEKICRGYDLLVEAMGNPGPANIVNSIAIKLEKPTVFGGVFAKAAGGFVLSYKPGGACRNCIYDASKLSMVEDKETLEAHKKAYGWSEGELERQQGIYLDVSFVSLFHAKMALLALLDQKHNIGFPRGNLLVWNNQQLKAQVMEVKAKKDCYACNQEGWLASVNP